MNLPPWLHAELGKLNPEQRQAVATDHPRLLTIAPAGSGKTRCLTLRTARLMLTECPGERILCVTFTRAAAKEMVERITQLIITNEPNYRGTFPEVSTLHSFGARLIRRFPHFFGLTRDFTIYDEKDKADVIRSCARDLGMEKWNRSKMPTLWREERVQRLYYDRLQQSNAIDYDLIEDYTLKLLKECPDARQVLGYYRHVLVDEYQDTNLAQVLIVNRLLEGDDGDRSNLFIVGDPRQSIYRFRGAEPQTIVDNARDADFEVVHLVRNYRSVPAVVELSNACVMGDWPDMVASRQVPDVLRNPNLVQAFTHDNEPECVSEVLRNLHAGGTSWGEMTVLARNWAPLRAIREQLVADNVPHAFLGDDDDPWATDEGRAVARCALLALNTTDNNLAAFLAEWGNMGDASRFKDLRRLRAEAIKERKPLIEVMAQENPDWDRLLIAWGNGQHHIDPAGAIFAALHQLRVLATYRSRELTTRVQTIERCVEHIESIGTLEDFREWWIGRTTAEKALEAKRENVVRLMTVHASKGLEFPVTVLADCRHGVYPTTRKTAEDEDRAEDMRVLYVAITRARNKLVLTAPTTYTQPWGRPKPKPVTPARYVLQGLHAVGKTFIPWSQAW